MTTTDSGKEHSRMELITAGLLTKSAKIRALAEAEYSRNEIAKYLEISYQHVWNVLNAPAPTRPEGQPATTDVLTGTIGPGGRVVIPAACRKAMAVEEGDEVVLQLEDGTLHIMSRAAAIERARELVASYVPAEVDLVEELLADRRREAVRENSE